MADNVAITAGSGTTIAADDIGAGVLVQRVKSCLGADGTAVDPSAGAGAVGTGTQRVTLGSDDPAVVSLGIMDDWDESNRAMVNIVVGQAGVTAGAGAVAANTPRVTLASDDPAVASLSVLDDWDESDRAKTNPIVGQAGVAGGTGTVGATTQRVTLATDIALPAGELHIAEVGGNLSNVAVEFTRPADTTAYAALDAVSDSTSATTVQALANFARVSGGSGYITGARLSTDKKSITPRFRVHLWNASTPTVAVDNAAYKRLYADEAKYLGYFDLPSMVTEDGTNGTDSVSQDMTIRIPYTTVASRSVFFTLETLDIFTPASGQKFTLRLWGENN
jgi:hypothetical protein